MRKGYNRSKIMMIAHALKRVYKMSFSESQKLAWANTKLRFALHQGPVEFCYRKKDGELRPAIGTLHNVEPLLVGSNKFSNDILTLRYYDLEKDAFRAMKMNSLVSVNNVVVL